MLLFLVFLSIVTICMFIAMVNEWQCIIAYFISTVRDVAWKSYLLLYVMEFYCAYHPVINYAFLYDILLLKCIIERRSVCYFIYDSQLSLDV